ncbi:hypothetical protein [Desulfovibrio sp. QI0442]
MQAKRTHDRQQPGINALQLPTWDRFALDRKTANKVLAWIYEKSENFHIAVWDIRL